jgi:hypothetical protein
MTMSDERGRRREAGGAEARFDLAIDRAVREMLDVEPPAGLRGRVLRRIEGGDSRSRVASGFGGKILWTALPVAAAAMVMLALLPSRTLEPPRPVTVARVESPKTPSVIAPGTVPEPEPAAAGRAPVRSAARNTTRPVTRPVAERAVVAASLPAGEYVEVDPLEPIEPIVVAAVRPASIAEREIVVSPLGAIPPVQIAPLSPPDGRN